MSDRPIVSVIIPTKNSAGTLEKCLSSIKDQSYTDIELIVVDNFSTDNTPAIAQKYTDKFFQKGPERCAQRNFGVQQASGEFVAILDSDMYLAKDIIKECVNELSQDRYVGVIIPEQSVGEGFWSKCKALERSFYVGVPYMEAARFFKKSIFNQVGGYDESMVSGEDWDLSQRIQKLGDLSRTNSYISHDEQRISLLKTIRKKFYYAQKFKAYAKKNKQSESYRQQTNPLRRYWLFLSQPRKLWRHPIVAIGMLYMKTCEFGFGLLGSLFAKVS